MTERETSIGLALLFHQLIKRELPELRAVGEEQASQCPGGNTGWTRKEELGHLLDSAINNHMRFVLAALGPGEFRGAAYAQDDWVELHGYQGIAWVELLELWRLNNTVLARVVERIPEERLKTMCIIGSGEAVTLRFVIEDYVSHMQHHLGHLLSREKITAYPSAAT